MNGNDVSLVRAVRGPITLITIGVLFALNNFTPYRFDQTWPVILIVFGLLSLLRRGTQPYTPGPGAPPRYSPPPAGYTGSYRQSPYGNTAPPQPTGPVTGGFGSSAPARPVEPEQKPASGENV